MRKRLTQALVVLSICLACCSFAFALDPALDISQYAHTAWRVRDGFAKGPIYAIAQTPDGYLWLGTEFGLLRFDGVRAVPWMPPNGQLPSNEIPTLLVTRDGTFWIGTTNGLASWKDGKLITYSELNGSRILALLEDRNGTVWVAEIFVDRIGRLRSEPSEAVVRSAKDHSAENISNLVRRIVDERMAEGQLDDCDLTIRDIEQVKRAFTEILVGMYHPRVEYPTAVLGADPVKDKPVIDNPVEGSGGHAEQQAIP